MRGRQADVLRRRILEVYGELEEVFAGAAREGDLEATLRMLADRTIDHTLSDSPVALGRILSAQAARFPEIARLAVSEGYGRQLRFVETMLARFAGDPRYALGDLALAADLFLAGARPGDPLQDLRPLCRPRSDAQAHAGGGGVVRARGEGVISTRAMEAAMSNTRYFALDDHLAAFVEAEVAEGHYASENEVVSAGLRLLEDRARKLSALREALVEGEASGDSLPFDFDDFLARKRDSKASGV